MTAAPLLDRSRTTAVYVLVLVVGVAAFLYPFWIPGEALPAEAHAGDAPLIAAVVGALAVAAVTLEVRRGTMNGATVALLSRKLPSRVANWLIGRVTVRLGREVEVVVLAAYGWVWGFVFGAVMNLWFWPFVRDGSDLSWEPGMGLGQTLRHYWSFYLATSFAWDAAGAFANAVIIVVVGRSLLTTLRRHAHRLDPVTVLETADASPFSGT